MNSPLEPYNHASTESAVIPESYHPLIFVSVGVWGWGLHLSFFIGSVSMPLLLLAVILSWLIFSHILVLEDVIFVNHTNIFNHFGPVVSCYGLITCLIFFGPCHKESQRFLNCLYRLLFKCHYHQVYFSDVLVADILISFSGVFTGVFVRLMQQTDFAYSRLVPIITSIPYLIRFKQCCNDYFKETQERHRNKRQLVNAIKYASAIPVIFLAHHTKVPPNHFGQVDTSADILWHFWLFLALLTSAFAFVWDLVIDWGLFQVKLWSFAFRKDIHFSDPLWYIMAAAINMSLRLLKIVSHMYQIHPFCVDLAEILRRWIWVIFRFEHEWIKRSFNVENKL